MSSRSDPACADPNCSYRAEVEQAIESRENANAVSGRIEAENARLRAGISWARGMCTDEEPYTMIDEFLGGLLNA